MCKNPTNPSVKTQQMSSNLAVDMSMLWKTSESKLPPPTYFCNVATGHMSLIGRTAKCCENRTGNCRKDSEKTTVVLKHHIVMRCCCSCCFWCPQISCTLSQDLDVLFKDWREDYLHELDLSAFWLTLKETSAEVMVHPQSLSNLLWVMQH